MEAKSKKNEILSVRIDGLGKKVNLVFWQIIL